jgi:hypothetical protein
VGKRWANERVSEWASGRISDSANRDGLIDVGSAMEVQYPVTCRVLATAPSFICVPAIQRRLHNDLDSSYKSIIEVQEVRDHFLQLGKLSE